MINAIAGNVLFRLFKVNTTREDNITFDDISAGDWMQGAQAGVLQKQEHHFIENVFELEERNVPSSMTTRENVVFFTLKESLSRIRQKLARNILIPNFWSVAKILMTLLAMSMPKIFWSES